MQKLHKEKRRTLLFCIKGWNY